MRRCANSRCISNCLSNEEHISLRNEFLKLNGGARVGAEAAAGKYGKTESLTAAMGKEASVPNPAAHVRRVD